MTTAAPLLIVWHSRTGASEAAARAASVAAGSLALMRHCDEVDADSFRAARGYLFCGPENLGSLSGAMKEMFDRLYYPLLGAIEGRGYATIIAAGSDGSGAQRQLDRIVTGWRLRRVADALIVSTSAAAAAEILAPKMVAQADLHRCAELGAALGIGLSEGLF